MSEFGPALEYLLDLEDEGRTYVEVTDNNGGKVIAGINSKSFPKEEAAIAAVVPSLRSTGVYKFYFAYFWQPLLLGSLQAQDIANRVLAASVNSGMYSGIKLLQEAANACGASITVDGKIGPITVAAANSADPASLLSAFRQQLEAAYRLIAAHNPEDQKFIGTDEEPGVWIRRARA